MASSNSGFRRLRCLPSSSFVSFFGLVLVCASACLFFSCSKFGTRSRRWTRRVSPIQSIRTVIKRILRQIYRLQELVSSVCRIVSWHDRWERAVPRFLGSYDASIFLLLWLRDSRNRESSLLCVDLILNECYIYQGRRRSHRCHKGEYFATCYSARINLLSDLLQSVPRALKNVWVRMLVTIYLFVTRQD